MGGPLQRTRSGSSTLPSAFAIAGSATSSGTATGRASGPSRLLRVVATLASLGTTCGLAAKWIVEHHDRSAVMGSRHGYGVLSTSWCYRRETGGRRWTGWTAVVSSCPPGRAAAVVDLPVAHLVESFGLVAAGAAHASTETPGGRPPHSVVFGCRAVASTRQTVRIESSMQYQSRPPSGDVVLEGQVGAPLRSAIADGATRNVCRLDWGMLPMTRPRRPGSGGTRSAASGSRLGWLSEVAEKSRLRGRSSST